MWNDMRASVLLVIVFFSLASVLTVSALLNEGGRWFGSKSQSMYSKNQYNNTFVESVTFSLDVTAHSETRTGTWVEVMSWVPRAFVLHNFLTPEECEHLINEAREKLKRSEVLNDPNSKGSKEAFKSNYRTSSGTFLARLLDEKIGEIEERVSIITGIPLVNGGEMQVLRYEHMQKYAAHNDYFPFEYLSEKDGRQRTATILFYLTDVEKGGETHFPVGRPLKDYVGRHNEELINFSFCARRSASFGTYSPAAVRPKRGDALLFYSMDPSNQLVDPFSNHEGCPVKKGVKWSSTIWMHQGPFRNFKPTVCRDEKESCSARAESGECQANPLFMGSNCRMSCNICKVCQPDDALCERKNSLQWKGRHF